MTTSGEHDINPYYFVHVAMNNVGKSGLSASGCYYFFMHCKLHPEVDVSFKVEMDDALKGSTADLCFTNTNEDKGSNKKRAYSAMIDISTTAKSIAIAMDKTNRLAEQAQMIEIAKALGKHDILEKLLASMSSSDG